MNGICWNMNEIGWALFGVSFIRVFTYLLVGLNQNTFVLQEETGCISCPGMFPGTPSAMLCTTLSGV